jgi:hypothetical protein
MTRNDDDDDDDDDNNNNNNYRVKSRGRVVKTPALYSGDPGFNYRTRDLLA